MRAVAVIQARMGSRRLPGKVLRPMAGAPMLTHLIERARRSTRLADLAVATSDSAQDDPIEALCRRTGTRVHRGSETDVLARTVGAAEAMGGDIVVRLTGDNPLVDGILIDDLLDAFLPRVPPLVYAQTVDGSGFPLGLCVEAVTLWALHTAMTSDDPPDREHVTRFVRQRPEIFPTLVLKSPMALQDHSVTVDTEDDFLRVAALFDSLRRRDPAFTYHDVIDALSDRPAAGRAAGKGA